MKKEMLKNKIINFMKADVYNKPKIIDKFVILVAKDYTDVDNLNYFLTLFDALCELEEENIVEDVSGLSLKNTGILEKLKRSQWRLKTDY